jgi:hypothetical protein
MLQNETDLSAPPGGFPARIVRPASLATSDVAVSVISGCGQEALAASLEARGLRGLDILRRSVDRAPPRIS